jgi:hypothetical protein
MRQRCVALIPEDQLTARCPFTPETALMHQVMMTPAKQNQVVQISLSAVSPVLYVMPIHEFVIRTARETAAFVSHA